MRTLTQKIVIDTQQWEDAHEVPCTKQNEFHFITSDSDPASLISFMSFDLIKEMRLKDPK